MRYSNLRCSGVILGKSIQNLEDLSGRSFDLKTGGASIKDVLKEQRFLEKKVALSRKRKRESRYTFILFYVKVELRSCWHITKLSCGFQVVITEDMLCLCDFKKNQ